MAALSRSERILRVLQTYPRHLFNKYPEQFVAYSTLGVAGAICLAYKISKYGVDGVRPYYRGRYQVVRPDDPIALNWRTPEEYPPPYLSNRDNESFDTVSRDYGWKNKI